MAKVKYVVKEYIPSENQPGAHSFYAEARPDNVISNAEIAKKVENRGISRASEIKMILEEASKVILEELAENNRVQLDTGEGVLVSIYPKVQGSISDAQVAENPTKYNGASVATEAMLTPDMLKWSLGASVGIRIKYSKQFALQKQAEKVAWRPTDEEEAEPTAEPTTPTGGNQGGTPGSGDDGMS